MINLLSKGIFGFIIVCKAVHTKEQIENLITNVKIYIDEAKILIRG